MKIQLQKEENDYSRLYIGVSASPRVTAHMMTLLDLHVGMPETHTKITDITFQQKGAA